MNASWVDPISSGSRVGMADPLDPAARISAIGEIAGCPSEWLPKSTLTHGFSGFRFHVVRSTKHWRTPAERAPKTYPSAELFQKA